MKKISVIIKDKNTLVLEEDAKCGDIIDLRELSKFDSSVLEKEIEAGENKVYNSKLQELKNRLELEKTNEIDKLNAKIKLLETEHQANIINERHKVEDNYKEEINRLNNALSNIKNELEAKSKLDLQKKESEYLSKINELNSKLSVLEKTNEVNLKNKELELKSKYEAEISKLENESAIKESKFNLDHEKAMYSLKQDYEEKIREKETIINNLQNQKAHLNVKQTGEDLEAYCDNLVKEQMQNGFFNCTWEKDNIVMKDEGEKKGSKADYIFKIYASEDHNQNELLASVCLDMKDENPDSVNKQTNEHYYKQLDNNRIKKDCKYAVLVSNLEMDKANTLPIFKVREYENMYVVRPGYLMTFLHLITSLTTRFRDLLLSKEEEMLQIKDKLQVIEEFNSIKNTYLDKPLEALEKDINCIVKANDTIVKASNEIYNSCNHVINKYIGEIEAKLDRFELKLNSEYKKISRL